jgi:GNAT superfamily N-acetyltransferase
MGSDLIVNLYENNLQYKPLEGIKVQRVFPTDFTILLEFISKHFSPGWIDEVKAGMYQPNPTVFIAVKDKEIVGFAAYDCTAKGYFGPTGVNPNFHKQGIGTALLLSTLHAMKDAGYGYAVIGGAGDRVLPFYSRYLKLTKIDREHSVYDQMIRK